MKKLFFLLLLTAAAPLMALELSLEENKGESGTVGYVDIDRVFKEYSGTLNAREEFLAEIKKKEESVNQRRREIYTLKADIGKLKQEREFALTLPSILATQQQLTQESLRAAAVSTSVPPAAADTTPTGSKPEGGAAVSISTTSAALLPGMAPAPGTPLPEEKSGSTSTATTALTPGLATVPVLTSTPTLAPVPGPTLAPAAEPAVPAAVPLPANLPGAGIDMPGVAKVPVNYFKFSVSTAIPEIDAAIVVKENELRQKEEALKVYQRQVEKELLEYESHRSEMLLGRIYIALKELAVKQEVSVIIDKRNILFGHSAVDLTGKLLEKLESEQ